MVRFLLPGRFGPELFLDHMLELSRLMPEQTPENEGNCRRAAVM
jgi:hypothetical protein